MHESYLSWTPVPQHPRKNIIKLLPIHAPLLLSCSMHHHLNISFYSSPKHDNSLLRPLCSWLESLSITVNVDMKATYKSETTPTIMDYI